MKSSSFGKEVVHERGSRGRSPSRPIGILIKKSINKMYAPLVACKFELREQHRHFSTMRPGQQADGTSWRSTACTTTEPSGCRKPWAGSSIFPRGMRHVKPYCGSVALNSWSSDCRQSADQRAIGRGTGTCQWNSLNAPQLLPSYVAAGDNGTAHSPARPAGPRARPPPA